MGAARSSGPNLKRPFSGTTLPQSHSRADREPVLPAAPLAEARNPLVVSNQWTSELDRRGNQQTIGRVSVLEMVQLIGTRGSAVAEEHRLDAWTVEKPLSPCIDRNVEVDTTGIDEQGDLPDRHGTQINRTAVVPAAVDQRPGRRAQAIIASV